MSLHIRYSTKRKYPAQGARSRTADQFFMIKCKVNYSYKQVCYGIDARDEGEADVTSFDDPYSPLSRLSSLGSFLYLYSAINALPIRQSMLRRCTCLICLSSFVMSFNPAFSPLIVN